MTPTMYLILFISNLLYVEVASDYSFLEMKNIETYMISYMKVYDTENTDLKLNTSVSIERFFDKVQNYMQDLEKIHVNLRFDAENIWLTLSWDIPGEIDNYLYEILTATRSINQLFESYYLNFVYGFYTIDLIQEFINTSFCSSSNSLNEYITQMYNIIFLQGSLKANKNDFFGKLSEKLNKTINRLCRNDSTQSQFLIPLYSFIIRTQFRAFIMMTSAHKLRSILLNSTSTNYLEDIKNLKIYFLSKCSFCLEKMQQAVAKTTTEYYNCQTAYEYNYDLKSVYAIDLSPTIVDYKQNKVVTGVQFELKNGFLSLVLYDGVLLKNGKVSTKISSFGKHYAVGQRQNGYILPKDRQSDDHSLDVERVDESFWKNISFLNTHVPENHVVIGANFEVLKFDPNNNMTKKILYLRLHCAKINIKTGRIDTSNIIYTKVWTRDDPALQHHVVIAEDDSLKRNVQEIYQMITINISRLNTKEIWRRKPPLNYFIDSSVIQVFPPLPLTGIGIWQNTFQQEFYLLSMKIFTIDISSHIKPQGVIYKPGYSVVEFLK